MCNLIVSHHCTNPLPPALTNSDDVSLSDEDFPILLLSLVDFFLHTHIEFNIINMILIIITALTHLHYKMKNISCLASLCSIMPPPPAAASVNLTYNHQSRVEYSLPMYKFYMLTSSLIVSYVYRFFYCSMSCLHHKFPFLLFLVFLLFLHW